MPKQEFVAAELVKYLDRRHPCLILNGGAILDFLADRFPRAPHTLRRFRLEWLFRLFLEPGRLWRRYILGGLIFSTRLARVAWVCRQGYRAKLGEPSDIAKKQAERSTHSTVDKAVASS